MELCRRCILITIFAASFVPICTGQSGLDQELSNLFQEKDTSRRNFTSHLHEADNDIATLASVSFLIYKSFISSQDNPSCVFTPSCSEYAVQSIQKSGFILGWLSTFDRLSRCHGLVNHHHYPFDMEKLRFYDPVQ